MNKWSTSRFELALELAKREQPQGSQGSNGSWLLKEVKPPHAELAISTNASKVLLQLGSKTQAWLRRLPAHFSFETRAKASEHMLWHRCRRMKSDERLFHVHHGQCMANAWPMPEIPKAEILVQHLSSANHIIMTEEMRAFCVDLAKEKPFEQCSKP